jgi:hypothetical protein
MPSPLESLPQVTSAQPIRSSMDRALAETLAKLPPSSGRGFVEATITNTGIRAEGAARIGKGLDAGGWVGRAHGSTWEYGARARWRF